MAAANGVPGAVRTLAPGYFALVMATGIVSIAMRDLRLYTLSAVLLWLAGLAYGVLVVLSVWRLLSYRAEIRTDLTNPRRAFGFFTFVAGTDVLGTRLVTSGHHRTALLLLGIGGVGWLVGGYAVPWTAVFGRSQRPVIADANGTWFVWVVASQSVAVLAAVLEPTFGGLRQELALLAVVSWSVGVFLYMVVGVVVVVRLMVHELRPADFTQPYWVSMGATAITVVAGAQIARMAEAPALGATRSLIAGSSVLFWALGTWLIPALVVAGWWRHVRHRVPLRYDATWWSVVFPLGMYAVAGQFLGAVDHLPIVARIGQWESWLALAAWLLVFAVMLRHLSTTLLRVPAAPS